MRRGVRRPRRPAVRHWPRRRSGPGRGRGAAVPAPGGSASARLAAPDRSRARRAAGAGRYGAGSPCRNEQHYFCVSPWSLDRELAIGLIPREPAAIRDEGSRMRALFASVVVMSAAPALSAPSCPPSRWVLADGEGRSFGVSAYGIGTSGRYTAIVVRGRIGNRPYFISNEYAPQATGGPWSSSEELPRFLWGGRPVPLKWGDPPDLGMADPDMTVFEGPLKGEWRLKSCRPGRSAAARGIGSAGGGVQAEGASCPPPARRSISCPWLSAWQSWNHRFWPWRETSTSGSRRTRSSWQQA